MWSTLAKIAAMILAKNNSPAFNRITGLKNMINSGKSVFETTRDVFGGKNGI